MGTKLLCGIPQYAGPRLPLSVCRSLSTFGLCVISLKLVNTVIGASPTRILVGGSVFGRCGKKVARRCMLRRVGDGNISPVCCRGASGSHLRLSFIVRHGTRVIPVRIGTRKGIQTGSLATLLKGEPRLRTREFSVLPCGMRNGLAGFPLCTV